MSAVAVGFQVQLDLFVGHGLIAVSTDVVVVVVVRCIVHVHVVVHVDGVVVVVGVFVLFELLYESRE